MRVKLNKCPVPIEQEARFAIPTGCAAFHLSRRPQTLRKWAMQGGSGEIKPIRVNGRLLWPVQAIRKILGVEV